MPTLTSQNIVAENIEFSNNLTYQGIPLTDNAKDDLFKPPTLVTGSASYTTPGTYSFIAPAGVYEVSVVTVGGGGSGQDSWANPAGGGGGLGWKNSIRVVPGRSYAVVVGDAGKQSGYTGPVPFRGGTSYFISTETVAGYGGGNQQSSSTYQIGPNGNGNNGGGYFGDGGGAGGNCTSYNGGGGAGGYTDRGGDASENDSARTGGGGGGGGYYSSTYGTGAGGGVGLNGIGTTGTRFFVNGSYYTSPSSGGGGEPGSGGERGMWGENPYTGVGESSNNIKGGNYGGGGGGPGTSYPSASGDGGVGGVRIIWGPNRSFPNAAS